MFTTSQSRMYSSSWPIFTWWSLNFLFIDLLVTFEADKWRHEHNLGPAFIIFCKENEGHVYLPLIIILWFYKFSMKFIYKKICVILLSESWVIHIWVNKTKKISHWSSRDIALYIQGLKDPIIQLILLIEWNF
jgi:hypothetical protein